MVYKLMRIVQKHPSFHSSAFLVVEDDQWLALANSVPSSPLSAAMAATSKEKSHKQAAPEKPRAQSIATSTTALTYSGQLLSFCEDDTLAMFQTLQSVISFAITNKIDKTEGIAGAFSLLIC